MQLREESVRCYGMLQECERSVPHRPLLSEGHPRGNGADLRLQLPCLQPGLTGQLLSQTSLLLDKMFLNLKGLIHRRVDLSEIVCKYSLQ